MLLSLLPHLGVAIAALSLGAIWETLTDPGHASAPRSREVAVDLGYGFLNVVLVTPIAIAVLAWLEPHVTLTRTPVSPIVGLLLGFFLFEGVTYGLHRLWHSAPWLMRWHRVHHAPHRLHSHVAFRMHPVETFAYIVLGNLPLLVLGMPAWGGLYVVLAERTYAVILHARAPFALPGPLGKIFASGEFHHRHHGRGPAANFGGVLSCFDYLFGTSADASRDAASRAIKA